MKNRTNIYLAIFVIIFILFAYFWYSGIRISSVTTGGSANKPGGEFLITIEKLKTINLDVAFLKGDWLQFLEDLTPVITAPKEFGRKNPFSGPSNQ